MRILKIVVLLVVIGLGLYVRLAPSDVGKWHAMPDDVDHRDLKHGAMRVVEIEEGGLQRLHVIVVSTARTKVLAGTAEEGMVTYITRSRVFGFPDYTTVRKRPQRIEIFGRLRFGHSDFGVNATRIDTWLNALSQ